MIVRKYDNKDLDAMIRLWNAVVEEGVAFPQEETLSHAGGKSFFGSQTFCGVACDEETGRIFGLYILHPNSVGRCGHICNASYAVDASARGKHIGEQLVKHCMHQASQEGFKILQFNAVVKTNTHARHLYERCGFKQLGTIPGGFRMKDGHYEDICPYYIEVQ
jgi:L-amino acid N-acyltransferase YncA